MERKTRKQAIDAGEEFYFTGKPCKYGGVAPRRVNNYQCMCDQCTIIGRYNSSRYQKENPESCAERKKRWHRDNKERISRESREYYLSNRGYFLERAAEYRSTKPVEVSECKKRWYERNREHALTKARNRYNRIKETPEYRERRRLYYLSNKERILSRTKQYARANREYLREATARWREENRGKVREYQARRRAVKRDALPPWYGEFDEFVVQEAYDLLHMRRQSSGFGWHVDHMIPLQAEVVCGLHCAQNMQVIPERMNQSKGNRMIYTEHMEWLNEAEGAT